MLAARGLRKASIPDTLIRDPSPGSLQPTRVAIHSNDGDGCGDVYVASGNRVYKFEISLSGVSPGEGKDGLMIPSQTQISQSHMVDRCPHHSEIQSITLADGDGESGLMMGTVDCYGQVIVSGLGSADINNNSYSLSPRGYGVGEGSWAGICFNPGNSSMAAIVHSFCKSIDIYDQDIHLQSYQTLWYPSSSTFLQESVLAVGEGSQLTIWDMRCGGCVQKVNGSIGDLIYAVSGSLAGNVAVGGSDRCLTIYDPRRWSAVARWVGCSKYEITGLAFSSLDPDYIYVQGVDYEVFCGQWRQNKKVFTFRGDSNWLGFSKDRKFDVLAGWCDSGSIFVADAVSHR